MPTTFLGSTLPLERTNRGYFQTTANSLENEKSKFINLILTRKGERVANPQFGCDLWRLLFENKNNEIQDLAQQYVLDAINRFMPYLVLQELRITNLNTILNDNNLNLYVKYGFFNNPLLSDEVQLNVGSTVSGQLVVTGRTTGRNF